MGGGTGHAPEGAAAVETDHRTPRRGAREPRGYRSNRNKKTKKQRVWVVSTGSAYGPTHAGAPGVKGHLLRDCPPQWSHHECCHLTTCGGVSSYASTCSDAGQGRHLPGLVALQGRRGSVGSSDSKHSTEDFFRH